MHNLQTIAVALAAALFLEFAVARPLKRWQRRTLDRLYRERGEILKGLADHHEDPRP